MSKLYFKDVSLQYPVYNATAMSLRNQLVRLSTGGLIASDAGSVVTVSAINNASFELNKGDAVGLVGHNGAGKSTLLRLMAGIYSPTNGEIIRDGTVATVFELGAGMDSELTGYENIIRMLMLLGHSFLSAKSCIPDIEEFTELGDFLNLPMRTYSSGMTMRLMFAVATSVKPTILLIDEMFGVGDAEFQEKAQKRLQRWISEVDIFVFASHNHELIKRLCNRVFRLEHGQITEEAIQLL